MQTKEYRILKNPLLRFMIIMLCVIQVILWWYSNNFVDVCLITVSSIILIVFLLKAEYFTPSAFIILFIFNFMKYFYQFFFWRYDIICFIYVTISIYFIIFYISTLKLNFSKLPMYIMLFFQLALDIYVSRQTLPS